MPERLRQVIPVAIGLVLFLVALEVLRVELRTVTWPELTADVIRTPAFQLGLALVLTAINYVALTGYDLLAFASIGKALPRRRIAVASFLAYAISNNVGFAMLSGASVRYRFYTRWGVTTEELSRIVVAYSVTFWLGLLGLGGLSLVVSPLPSAPELPAQVFLTPIGWLLMLVPPDVLLTLGIVAQRAAKHGHLERQTAFLNMRLGPDFVEQGVFGDDFAVTFEEHAQNLRGLRCKGNAFAVARQETWTAIEPKLSKFVNWERFVASHRQSGSLHHRMAADSCKRRRAIRELLGELLF